jgi:hypothetical protein
MLAAVVAAAVALFIVLQAGSDDEDGSANGPASATTTAAAEVLTVNDGEPVGGVRTLTYEKGEQVNLEVRLNRPEEEIHVHGYEIERPALRSPARLSFPARLDGVFEIEVHRTDGSEAEIAELRVNP